jgi:hypothetical protein
MPKYKIARVYEVLATDRYEATDRLSEAFAFGDEKMYHAYDVIRPSDDATKAEPIRLEPPTGWLKLLREQLTGSKKKR